MRLILAAILAVIAANAQAQSWEVAGSRIQWSNDLDAEAGTGQLYALGAAPAGGSSVPYTLRNSAGGRVDWGSALELDHGDLGLRVSAEASIGDLYERLPAGTGLYVVRSAAASGGLVADPPALAHQDIQALDAYLHDSFTFGDDQRLTVRVGRHVLIWGESLYFPENGIAAGQMPVDATRQLPQSAYSPADLFRPVGQVSLNWRPESGLAVELYGQFEYRPSRYSNIGSDGPADLKLASADLARLKGQAPDAAFVADTTRTPDHPGQFGAAIEWRWGGSDLGVYAERYAAKTPVVVLLPTSSEDTGRYDLIYPTGIDLLGFSLASRLGDAGIGGEVSVRHGMPLVTAAVVEDAAGAPIPTGDTLHVNASWQYAVPPLPFLAGGATWSGELAANELIDAHNPLDRMPGRSCSAAAIRTVFEAQFPQILPRVDMTVPLGLGYGLFGRSSVDPTMTAGLGDIDLGIAAIIDQAWHTSLTLSHYLGRDRALYLPYGPNAAGDPLSAGDFVRLSIERKF
jgi:hypothetical protein